MLTRETGPRTWLRILASIVVVWAFLIVLVLLEIFPYTPKTPSEWVALCVGGPPAYVALAWFAERMLWPRIERVPAKRFSSRWFATMAAAIVTGSIPLAFWMWLTLRSGR